MSRMATYPYGEENLNDCFNQIIPKFLNHMEVEDLQK